MKSVIRRVIFDQTRTNDLFPTDNSKHRRLLRNTINIGKEGLNRIHRKEERVKRERVSMCRYIKEKKRERKKREKPQKVSKENKKRQKKPLKLVRNHKIVISTNST